VKGLGMTETKPTKHRKEIHLNSNNRLHFIEAFTVTKGELTLKSLEIISYLGCIEGKMTEYAPEEFKIKGRQSHNNITSTQVITMCLKKLIEIPFI
jgi:hypothetical protein